MRIAPIVPQPRKTSLLAVATDFSNYVDWQHAAEPVEWETLSEGVSGTWSRSTNGSVSKAETRRTNGVAFPNGSALPFTVYAADGADWFVPEDDRKRYQDYARAVLAAALPDEVEKVFWTGNVRGANYQSGIVDLPGSQIQAGSGSGKIVPTLWALIDQVRLTSGTKGRVVIHSPEAAFAAVKRDNLIERDGDVWYFGEHPWVFGAGYTNVGPNNTAPTAGNVWLAVSGPVEYALRPEVRILDFSASRHNQYRVFAEQDAFVRFDNSVVWASQAVLPTT